MRFIKLFLIFLILLLVSATVFADDTRLKISPFSSLIYEGSETKVSVGIETKTTNLLDSLSGIFVVEESETLIVSEFIESVMKWSATFPTSKSGRGSINEMIKDFRIIGKFSQYKLKTSPMEISNNFSDFSSISSVFNKEYELGFGVQNLGYYPDSTGTEKKDDYFSFSASINFWSYISGNGKEVSRKTTPGQGNILMEQVNYSKKYKFYPQLNIKYESGIEAGKKIGIVDTKGGTVPAYVVDRSVSKPKTIPELSARFSVYFPDLPLLSRNTYSFDIMPSTLFAFKGKDEGWGISEENSTHLELWFMITPIPSLTKKQQQFQIGIAPVWKWEDSDSGYKWTRDYYFQIRLTKIRFLYGA